MQLWSQMYHISKWKNLEKLTHFWILLPTAWKDWLFLFKWSNVRMFGKIWGIKIYCGYSLSTWNIKFKKSISSWATLYNHLLYLERHVLHLFQNVFLLRWNKRLFYDFLYENVRTSGLLCLWYSVLESIFTLVSFSVKEKNVRIYHFSSTK